MARSRRGGYESSRPIEGLRPPPAGPAPGADPDVEAMREALRSVLDIHRPLAVDGRLCAEGCAGRYPCTTYLEARHGLGLPAPGS